MHDGDETIAVEVEKLGPALKRLRLECDGGKRVIVALPITSFPSTERARVPEGSHSADRMWDESTQKWRRKQKNKAKGSVTNAELEDNEPSSPPCPISLSRNTRSLNAKVEDMIRQSITDSTYEEMSRSKCWQIMVVPQTEQPPGGTQQQDDGDVDVVLPDEIKEVDSIGDEDASPSPTDGRDDVDWEGDAKMGL